jgi:hypothetical protein
MHAQTNKQVQDETFDERIIHGLPTFRQTPATANLSIPGDDKNLCC